MFRHYFAICAFALSYCWSQFAHAEIPFEQARGVFDATKDDQKENSPLWGMVSLKSKILENIRFFGPYTIYSDKTNIFANEQEMQNHLKLLGLWIEPRNPNRPVGFERSWQQVQDVPQDFISALIQYLFPSPDGAIFVANERRGDLLIDLIRDQSGINLRKLNHLIEILLVFKKNYSKTSDWKQLRGDIFDLLLPPPSAQTKQGRTEQHHQKAIARKKNLEAIQKQQGKILQKHEWVPLLRQRKQEGKQLIASRYDVYNHKVPELNLKNDNDRKIFLALHLSHILARSLQQELNQDNKTSLYPKNIVILALQAYAWKVANNKTDLKRLTAVIKPESLTEDQFTPEYYFKNKDIFLTILQKSDKLPPEQVAFFREGYEAYEEIIPSLISYKTGVKYINEEKKEQTFPDCGETSLRNLLYIALNEKGKANPKYLEQLIKDKLGHPDWSPPIVQDPSEISVTQENDPLRQIYLYFRKYPSTSVAGTDTAHNDWSQIVSDLNRKRQRLGSNQEGLCQISYGGYSRCQECEIDAGLINMLNVIANLTLDEKLNELWKPQESDKLKQAAEKLNRLCELFSHEGFKLEWDINGKQEVLKNTGITITFAINGKDAFEWHINPMHFEIKKKATSGWPNKVLWLNQNFKNYPLLQAWFTQPKDLADSKYKQTSQSFFIFGQDLHNNNAAIQAANYLFDGKYQAYYVSAIKLLRPFFQDRYSLMHIMVMMLGYPELLTLFSDEEQEKLKAEEKKYSIKHLLTFAIADNYPSSLQRLVVQNKNLIDADDVKSLLSWAMRNDHAETIKLLLSNKLIKVNAKDSDGFTLLHRGLQFDCAEIVKLLLDNEHIDVNAKDSDGNTPLHLAVRYGHVEIIKLLLGNKRVDVNAKNSDGDNILIGAIRRGQVEIIKLLLDNEHVDVNAKDNYGYTSLHKVAQDGKVEIVKLLLGNKHVDVNAKDNYGDTPLHLAAQSGKIEIIKLLLGNKRVGVNVEDNYGDTPLRKSARRGEAEIVKLLLAKGAKVEQGDIDRAATKEINQLLRDAMAKQSTGKKE